MELIQTRRQVIPRWHLFEVGSHIEPLTAKDEFVSLSGDVSADFDEAVFKFRKSKTLPLASDILGIGLFSDSDIAETIHPIAKFVKKKTGDDDIRHDLANHFLAKESYSPSALAIADPKNIGNLRHRIRRFPRDSTAWIDLCFHYALTGKVENARRAAIAAMSAGMDNVRILRYASRFFVHIDDPEHALFYLRQSSIGKQNPWVMAAEIAISDAFSVSPKMVKLLKPVLNSKNFSAFDLAEANGALGTLELGSGSARQAKRLLQASVLDPTENALAQAVWALKRVDIDITHQNVSKENRFEALARVKLQSKKYKEAVTACKKWQTFQPLSASPAIFGSHLAAVFLDDHEAAIQMIDASFPASNGDFSLHNNRAFSAASIGRLAEAEKDLKLAEDAVQGDRAKGVLSATKGLLLMRKGKIEEGRSKYRDAQRIFQKDGGKYEKTMLNYFWLKEEVEAGAIPPNNLDKNLLEKITNGDVDEFLKLSKRLLEKLPQE